MLIILVNLCPEFIIPEQKMAYQIEPPKLGALDQSRILSQKEL